MSVDSGRDYGVISFGAYDNASGAKKAIDIKRNNNEELLKKYSTETPPEPLILFTSLARQSIKEKFKEIGLLIPDSQIVDPIFVDERYKSKLAKQLDDTYEEETAGVYGVVNKRPIIFLGEDRFCYNNYNYANNIYHEMFHSTGANFAVIDKDTIKDGRIGLAVLGPESLYKTVLLEEGLAVHESGYFCDQIVQILPKQYKKEFEMKQKRVSENKNHGKIEFISDETGHILRINPKYTFLSFETDSNNAILVINPIYALAGEFVDTMLNSVPKTEKDEFLKTIFLARDNPKQISKLASTIDNYFGKGMYVKILKCEITEKSILALTKELESKKSSKP